MMSCTVGIMCLTGQISFNGFTLNASGLSVFLFNLLMWFPQGASEEVMFRGFMIPAFNKRYKVAVGVVFSSLIFSTFHSLNSGYTPLASVNLVLIAVLFAMIYLLTGDIWMTSAMHTAWNLTQGNIYGLQQIRSLLQCTTRMHLHSLQAEHSDLKADLQQQPSQSSAS